MSAALEFRGVTLRFGATVVLRDASLAVARGERHALIGPNGAGKSTLFNLACGTLRPDAGRILLDGTDIAGRPPFDISRRGLARSHQVTSLFGELSVLDNLRCAVLGVRRDRYAFWRTLDGMPEVLARAETIADDVGLLGQRTRPARELPYAAQRALEIGVALAGDASLLLLDEPTAGMSQDESRATVELIRRVCAGRTLLLVEHDMDVVFGLADRVSVLSAGSIIASGEPAAVRRHPAVAEVYPTGAPARA